MQVAKIERHKHVAGVVGAERGKWAEKWAAEEGAEVERIWNLDNKKFWSTKSGTRQMQGPVPVKNE